MSKANRGNPNPSPATRFQAGNNANPGGRPKKTPLTDALRELANDPTQAKKIAAKLFGKALKDDSLSVQAFREIADRVEGKSIERVEHSGPDGEAIPVDLHAIDEEIAKLLLKSES